MTTHLKKTDIKKKLKNTEGKHEIVVSSSCDQSEGLAEPDYEWLLTASFVKQR